MDGLSDAISCALVCLSGLDMMVALIDRVSAVMASIVRTTFSLTSSIYSRITQVNKLDRQYVHNII